MLTSLRFIPDSPLPCNIVQDATKLTKPVQRNAGAFCQERCLPAAYSLQLFVELACFCFTTGEMRVSQIVPPVYLIAEKILALQRPWELRPSKHFFGCNKSDAAACILNLPLDPELMSACDALSRRSGAGRLYRMPSSRTRHRIQRTGPRKWAARLRYQLISRPVGLS